MITSAGRQGPGIRARRRTQLVLWCVIVLALSACGSGTGVAGERPDRPVTAASRAAAGQQPEAGNGDSRGISGTKGTGKPKEAGRARDRFTTALEGILAGDTDPSRKQIASALKSAGFDEVEVSIGQTPTGLEVEAMEAAVRFGGDCLVGQVRGDKLSVAVLPVLASGHCFVGDQR